MKTLNATLVSIAFLFFSSSALLASSYFETFYSTIKSKNITTVDEAIGEIPDELKGNYTLMRRSASLQGASNEKPRVISFTNNAKFLLSFTGKGQTGENIIETAEFDDKTQEVVFRSITFTDDKAIASEKNPTLCQACHGQNPTYIWSPYNTWVGQFGANDDLLSSEDQVQLKSFLAEAPSQPRYRHLTLKEETSNTLFPYYTSSGGRTFENMPGFRLGKYLMRWNAKRVYQRLKSQKKYIKALPLLVATTLECNVETFYSDDEKEVLDTFLRTLDEDTYLGNLEDKRIMKVMSLYLGVKQEREWSIAPPNTPYKKYIDGSFNSHATLAHHLVKDMDFSDEHQELIDELQLTADTYYTNSTLVPHSNAAWLDEASPSMRDVYVLTDSQKKSLCGTLAQEGYSRLDLE